MSVDLCVFVDPAAMPTFEEWQADIQRIESGLFLDNFSPTEQVGFVPAQLNGEQCGFEYSFGIDDAEWDVEIAERGTRSHVATFTVHGSRLDLRAAEITATALARLTTGVFFDPQSGSAATGSDVLDHIEDERKAFHEHRLLQAESKWAKVTDRRCPKCGARCPEYRGSCWVCEYPIGRVAD